MPEFKYLKLEQGLSTSSTLPVDKNKSAVIKMILQDKARRMEDCTSKTVMFGVSTLAASCAVGRKNSKNP